LADAGMPVREVCRKAGIKVICPSKRHNRKTDACGI
jgi:hypothetical protein